MIKKTVQYTQKYIIHVREITMDELECALEDSKNKKAIGSDNINIKLIKNDGLFEIENATLLQFVGDNIDVFARGFTHVFGLRGIQVSPLNPLG